MVDPGEDHEPDYRFTLANERTFLAWVRTALGLLAAGIAVRHVLPPLDVPGGSLALALGCVGLALVLAVACYPRWRRNQLAMRRGEPLPESRLLPLLAVGLVAVSLLTAVLVVAG